jgi:hypothetical protein
MMVRAGAEPISILKPVIAALLLLCGSFALAQARPEDGGHEFQLWSGGGHSVAGGRGDTSVWNVGVRYGWILTRPHGPGFLKGRFEYAVDAVPVFMVFQQVLIPAGSTSASYPSGTVYGGGVNPLNLKWDFASRGSIAPYLELSGGTLFTTQEVPPGTSMVNFTSGAALGAHFLGDTRNWSLELRYLHISNAGLTVPNPGINTVQVRLGIGKFFGSSRAGKR